MRSILFINRVYPPVAGATGQLLAELAPELVRAGWKVTVLTAAPKGVAPRTEEVAGVAVVRVSGLPFTRASHWRRALSYLSLYPALFWRALRLPGADVVVTLTDPPLLLVLGQLLRWVKGSRVVHWAQDLYPELAEELGVLKRGGLLASLLRAVSTWSLKRCDLVVPVGRCMRRRLLDRGVRGEAMEVIPNWGHGGSMAGIIAERDRFRREHGLDGRFVVMYSGNLGMAHPFEAMVDAAELMQKEHPEALFLFVGEGPRLPWVRRQVLLRRVDNVRFLPFQPRETLTGSLGAADLHLASMEERLCGLVVPSKVYGVVSVGRPCVLLGPQESEAARLILENDCGNVLTGPSGRELANLIGEWIRRPDRVRGVMERAATVSSIVSLRAAGCAFDRALRRALGVNCRNETAEMKSPAPALASLAGAPRK